jgi:hypothetical protein
VQRYLADLKRSTPTQILPLEVLDRSLGLRVASNYRARFNRRSSASKIDLLAQQFDYFPEISPIRTVSEFRASSEGLLSVNASMGDRFASTPSCVHMY